MYAVIPYATAMGATEIPWALGQTLLFSCICYFMIHFDFTAGELLLLAHLTATTILSCCSTSERRPFPVIFEDSVFKARLDGKLTWLYALQPSSSGLCCSSS